jgi:hypothetical protein
MILKNIIMEINNTLLRQFGKNPEIRMLRRILPI